MPSPRRWPGVKRQKPSWRPSSRRPRRRSRPARARRPGARGRRGSRRRRGSTPPGSRRGARRRARRRRPRRASAPWSARRAGTRPARAARGSTVASMYDWSLAGSAARATQPEAVALDDPRVVAGPEERRRRCARRTRAARRSGSCRCSGRTGSASARARSRRRRARRRRGGTPRAGRASRAGGRARGRPRGPRSRRRRAARALGVRPRRVEPEPERDADRVRPGPGSATALSTPPLIATATRAASGGAANAGPDRVRERVGGERLAGHGGRLEQRQPGEVALEPGRVGRDDPLAVDERAARARTTSPRAESPKSSIGHRARLARRLTRSVAAPAPVVGGHPAARSTRPNLPPGALPCPCVTLAADHGDASLCRLRADFVDRATRLGVAGRRAPGPWPSGDELEPVAPWVVDEEPAVPGSPPDRPRRPRSRRLRAAPASPLEPAADASREAQDAPSGRARSRPRRRRGAPALRRGTRRRRAPRGAAASRLVEPQQVAEEPPRASSHPAGAATWTWSRPTSGRHRARPDAPRDPGPGKANPLLQAGALPTSGDTLGRTGSLRVTVGSRREPEVTRNVVRTQRVAGRSASLPRRVPPLDLLRPVEPDESRELGVSSNWRPARDELVVDHLGEHGVAAVADEHLGAAGEHGMRHAERPCR